MDPERKRAWTTLAILALFLAAVAVLLLRGGAAAFDASPGGGSPWIVRASALCIVALAGSLLLFRRSMRPADLLGDERERELGLRASLLAKTILLLALVGGVVFVQIAFADRDTLSIPRHALGFGLALVMALYLGVRAAAVLVLFRRG